MDAMFSSEEDWSEKANTPAEISPHKTSEIHQYRVGTHEPFQMLHSLSTGDFQGVILSRDT